MWLRSIFLKTLRDYRLAIVSWGVGMGMLAPILFGSRTAVFRSPETQAELLAMVQNPVFRMFGEPVDILQGGGYVTWRLSLTCPMLAVWALLAASRTLRGEEERGALDLLLSVPRSRVRVATEKVLAIAAALLLIGLIISVLAFTGGYVTGVELTLSAALLFGLNIALLASVFGALALLVSQFTRERRPAAGVTAALLGLSIVLNSASRTVPDGEWIAWASPLHYFELSKPLIPTYGANPIAMIALAVLSSAVTALGVALFVRRDVGAPVALAARFSDRREPPAQPLPLASWSLGSVFARGLRSLAVPTLWWGLVFAAYTALFIAMLRQVQQNIVGMIEGLAKGNPMYAEMIAQFTGGTNIEANVALLSGVFMLLAVVPAAFAVTLANRWAAEEEEGRLELLLGTPHSRQRVILARFGGVVVVLLAMAGMLFTGAALAAAAVGMTLDTSRLAQAAFGMVPGALVVAAAGYLLSGWLRTAAVTGTLIALVFASFLISFLGSLLHLPKLLMRLSIFDAYGTPLVDGLRLSTTLALLAVAAAALALATSRFARKNLAG